MHLIVGLGNPGKKHENNRHNIGFMAIENIVQKHGLSSPRSRFLAETYETIIGGNKILLLKPSTFMNESGKAVYQAANFYKVPSEKIIIFHDEIDLIAGKIKLKRGGGHAGHNGLRSIHNHLGSSEFIRVRIGIGHPGTKDKVNSHVLGNFSADEKKWVEEKLNSLTQSLPSLICGNERDFMSQVSGSDTRKSDKNEAQNSADQIKINPKSQQKTSLMSAFIKALSKKAKK